MGTQTKTLAEQVADGIMNLIQETPYKAGDKLPTEKELCESTGAGRNTVREALKILASRNVLEIRQGAGTFVSEKQGIPDDPLGFSMVNDHVKLTKDLLQVRIMLEPQIAALAAQCAKEHEIKELEEILEEMEAAMKKAKSLGKIIAAHCEDNALLNDGYIHAGAYARAHGHRGICSESEWGQLKRDLELARETGCGYHACHISTKESVALLRRAKVEGIDVTCETAPHYLLLDDSQLCEDGRFKMNPPLRDKADREALLEGLSDGTIDIIATDHAPHSTEEKNRGLEKSAMGIVGLETAFPLLYTYLVETNIISFSRLIELLHDAPCRRFGIPWGGMDGQSADYTIFNLNSTYSIDPGSFLSMGRATPFAGRQVQGRCVLTVAGGKVAWSDGTLLPHTEG